MSDELSNDQVYHAGMRRLQDLRETRGLADRLAQLTRHEAFTVEDRAFIERSPMFFLATADAEGRPDCSYKGGMPGFVRVLDDRTLAFPDYDGNGMYRSCGNLLVNPSVGLLFIDFENGLRIRVNGEASIDEDDPLLAHSPGAVFIVRVRAASIFPNCPRYLHPMQTGSYAVHAPREDYTPPAASWKRFEVFSDVLPARDVDHADGRGVTDDRADP
jgi:predicted pyridoxine 5'-phosphate oxidase superfamily flavin-nucleotide-binding protein